MAGPESIESTPEQPLRQLPDSVNLHFLFAPHGTKEDFELLPNLLKVCDIYAPEVAVWDDELQYLYSQVALGSKSHYQRMQKKMVGIWDKEAKAFELKLIYGSHKRVLLTGLQRDDTRVLELASARWALSNSSSKPDEFIESMKQMGQVQKDREEKILLDLAKGIPAAIGQSKKLTEKPSVNVLVNLGPLHTAVYKTAADALNSPGHRRVTRTMFEKPTAFPLHVSTVRRYIFGLPVDIESLGEDVARMNRHRVIKDNY